MTTSSARVRRGIWIPLAILLAACGSDELPKAADGTNFEACADGSCEVQVTDGDRFEVPDLGPVDVTVKDDKIKVGSYSDDGEGNSFGLSAGGVAGQRLVLNETEFTVVAVKGEQGVLRLG